MDKLPRYYAGIGSRETPANVLLAMRGIAKELASFNFILRSGGASGADTAFEQGAKESEIFLPWKKFNGNRSLLIGPSDKAIEISRTMFPHFVGISAAARKLISRNNHQVLGKDIGTSPMSEFVICWTIDGKASGGTGYAIKVANAYDIPVYNLFNDIDVIKLKILIDDMRKERECLQR